MVKQKILVIDNDLSFLKYIKKILEENYKVIDTNKKENALNLAKTYIPDLIILGFLNPRGNSFKLHREFLDNPITNNIPQIVIDVKIEDHTRKGWNKEEGKQLESIDYISRPIQKDYLIKTIEGCLDYSNHEDFFNIELKYKNNKIFLSKNRVKELQN